MNMTTVYKFSFIGIKLIYIIYILMSLLFISYCFHTLSNDIANTDAVIMEWKSNADTTWTENW